MDGIKYKTSENFFVVYGAGRILAGCPAFANAVWRFRVERRYALVVGRQAAE